MILDWFDARGVIALGRSLAEQYAPAASASRAGRARSDAAANAAADPTETSLAMLLRSAETQLRALKLNIYKRAKFANSFKWRLIENGVDRTAADKATQSLVMLLSMNRPGEPLVNDTAPETPGRRNSKEASAVLARGNRHFAQGSYVEAIAAYGEHLRLAPGDPDAIHNLGAALSRVGRYAEAERCFRQAIEIRPDYPEAHANLGIVLRWLGKVSESEIFLRRALKQKPKYADARANLGLTLVLLGRLRDARARFEKVLKSAPRHVDATFGMGQIAQMEGRFEDAAAMYRRVLDIDPKAPNAWAALAGLRKMTPSDRDWLENAERIASSGIASLQEADLRFAIGKYCDDVKDFPLAFQNFKRANELLKSVGERYDRAARKRLVDDRIRVYTRKRLAQAMPGASQSAKPVFVVGMMRSGTSLVEQIVASHPAAKGAGELPFWQDAVREHADAVRESVLSEKVRSHLAEDYLRILSEHSQDAIRVVDKAPMNSDNLGIIHSVFPNARIICMRRDPIDSCLSCYFQPFSSALSFTTDLDDLAHYFREHRRLIAHWHSVLPAGTILDVPYAELVADQEAWTRKILDFLGLEFDPRCLEFHASKRSVVTASYWQVRQKIYGGSVRRWRNYEKFLGPLLKLQELDFDDDYRAAAR